MRSLRRRGLYLLSLLVSAACATIPKVPVHSRLAGQEIRTTVDSEITRYYVEDHLTRTRSRPDVDALIEEALKRWESRPLDSESLRDLSRHFSTDFATLYFMSRLYADSGNRRAQQAFHGHLAALRSRSAVGGSPVPERLRLYLIAFVPGYAYKRDPATGADFARQRWLLNNAGVHTVLLETDELGTVEENAVVLRDRLRHLAAAHDRIILVSTSKGGPEVALTIGKLMAPTELNNVKAWISVGGLLRGSPSADQALKWPRSWLARIGFFLKGLSPKVIENLSTDTRREVFRQLRFPEHVLMLQYVGVPLSGHIAGYVQGRYEELRDLGPNDGLTLLADQLVAGGIVVTDVGLDHYYLDPAIDLKTLALAAVVLDEVERRAGEIAIFPKESWGP